MTTVCCKQGPQSCHCCNNVPPVYGRACMMYIPWPHAWALGDPLLWVYSSDSGCERDRVKLKQDPSDDTGPCFRLHACSSSCRTTSLYAHILIQRNMCDGEQSDSREDITADDTRGDGVRHRVSETICLLPTRSDVGISAQCRHRGGSLWLRA